MGLRLTAAVISALTLLAIGAAAQDSSVKLVPRQETQFVAAPDGRVVLDVNVDPAATHGKTLTQDDFSITDNGVPVRQFFLNLPEPPPEVLIVLDALNSTFAQLAQQRDAVTHFLQANGGHLAQPVSVVLVDGVSRKADRTAKNGMFVIPLAGSGGSLRVFLTTTDGNSLAKALAKQMLFRKGAMDAQGAEGDVERVHLSMSALSVICDAEKSRPGRKLVIWTGPGWTRIASMTPPPGGVLAYHASLTESLRRARITLYQVDAGSLDTGFGFTSHALGSVDVMPQILQQAARSGTSAPGTQGLPSGDAINVVPAHRVTQQSLMLPALAIESGGLTLTSNTGVDKLLEICQQDAAGYYTLSYSEPRADSAIEYHAVHVDIRGAGGGPARTQYGYYVQPAPSSAVAARASGQKKTTP